MEELQRPLPPRSMRDRARAWVAWIGFGRIVGSAIAVVAVCAGAFWLVRTPPPPTEASIPLVSTTIPSTSITGSDHTLTSAAVERAASTDVPSIVVVHVAGAVVRAGVYELAPGSRVEDAVAAAGGPVPDADPNALNLAATVVDGSRVYV
ncbi:MAG: SLBB domain-containing protein, partial [Ilumatobacteraceae bacterium]